MEIMAHNETMCKDVTIMRWTIANMKRVIHAKDMTFVMGIGKEKEEELHLQPHLEIGCTEKVWNRLENKNFEPMGSGFGVVRKGKYV